ncbi:MAG TPA: TonB-dependent receptor, partial [Vicinamibacteria bacterium]
MSGANRGCRLGPIGGSVALLMLAGAAGAQTSNLSGMQLEDLLRVNVVTASKVEERVKDAPAVMTVITREEIEAFGAVSLVDVLNRATSFQLMSSHLWVQAKSVLRGNLITHADHHILILLNGRPFRDAMESNSNWTLYTAFPTELIERIEVIRGPGSVLYGSNAVSGVINIITRKPSGRAVRLGARGGSFGTGEGTAELGLSGGEWSLLLGAHYYHEDGWPFAAATNFPVPAVGVRRSQMDYGERNHGLSAFFEYRRLSAQLLYIDAAYDDLGIAPHWMFQGQVQGTRSFLDLSYVQPLSGSWSLKASLGVNDWEKHILDETQPGLDNNWDNATATVLEVAANGKLGEKTNVVVGGLTERRANRDIPETIPGVQAPGIPGKYSEKHYSAYVQADHAVRDRLKLVSGVQWNRTGSGHTAAVPRLGAIVPVSETLTLKALWGQAFRTATPLEEFVNVPGVLLGRADLRPEKASTF